jgi:hypothetical protein
MGGGKGKAPPPIDPGESMGKYLFGQNFQSFGGVTDPVLQERLISAEEQFRPRYAALELKDIGTFARGTEDTPGLFDLLEESGRRAGEIQRESLAEQRAADVAALQEFSPQVVEAYRQADPRSAELADLASQRAQEDLGIAEKGEQISTIGEGLAARGDEFLDTQLQEASQAEQKLLKTGGKLADLTPTEQEAVLQKSGIQLASLSPTQQEALLQQRGTEFLKSTGQLSSLEKRRVEQQARAGSMARGRLMDESGLYSEVQARMAEELGKQEREIALGSQLLGQEAGMRGQRIGLGANLLGQEAGMRDRRVGLGGQFLQAGEGLAAQRRAEQLQRQQFGAGLAGQGAGLMGAGASLIGQEAGIMGQRLGQAYGMQRGIAGDLGSAILGRPSQSLALGGGILGQAQGQAAGPMGPQLFDPNVGINLALQQRGQDIEFQGMQAQARGAMLGGFGGALGGYFMS